MSKKEFILDEKGHVISMSANLYVHPENKITFGDHTFNAKELGELLTYLLEKRKNEENMEKSMKEFTEKVIKGEFVSPNTLNKEE